jgi:parallel beta-helix repeat protein
MKTKLHSLFIVLAFPTLLTINSQHSTAFAQGSLTPPGAPAPTMKTLDQVEPRIPIGVSTTPGDANGIFNITNSGSYYLTGNVYGQTNKSGIVVAADNVTIDLCGYALIGSTTNSLDGIRPSGTHQTIKIRNGIITGWGGNAVNASIFGFPPDFGASLNRCVYEDIVANDNGGGIYAGSSSSIFRCVSRNNKGAGIRLSNSSGVCQDCLSDSNQGDGIDCAEGATVIHCSVQGNTGVGIYCGNSQQTIIGCNVRNNGGGGIFANTTLVRDCTIDGNTGYGVQIVFSSMIEGCNIGDTTGSGIAGISLAGNGRSLIRGNNIHDNTVGITLTNNPGNCIYGNTLRNTTDLDVGSGNSVPSSSDPTTAGPWYNIVL